MKEKKDLFKKFRSKQKIPKIITHQNIVHNEKWKMIGLVIIFPLVLVGIFIITSALRDFVYGIFVTILIIPWVVYMSIHQKATPSTESSYLHILTKSKNSSESFFEKINYERAPIRFYNLSRYLRIYLLVAIIVLFLTAIGIYFIYQSELNKDTLYDKKLAEYKENRQNLSTMSDDEITDAFTALIYSKSEYELQNDEYEKSYSILVNNMEKEEYELTFEQRREIDKQVRVIIDGLTTEDLMTKAIDEMESMTPIAMRLALVNEIERDIPYRYSNPNLIWQQNFLISSLFTFGMIFISLYGIRLKLISKSDFYHYLSLSCFKTYEKFQNLEQEEKRNYVIWGLDYYNDYIKSNHKKRIENLDSIQSCIMLKPLHSLDNIAKDILGELENKDRLGLIRTLGSIIGEPKMKISLIFNDKRIETFRDRISLVVVLVPVITAVIGIIQQFW
ncbi:hypothetical protein [Nitrosopumilus sp.]|uniref:hypothetical protein n=1 Tax=Nitrosopumilus sp. TaxID=2024843 RepID=UPI003D0F68FA